MKIAFFNTKAYDRLFFDKANHAHGHKLVYHESHLRSNTVSLVEDEQAVCCFINDSLDAEVLTALHAKGVRLIALRSAGFNHVDMACARRLGLPVVRVPAYSPYAVAEHTVGLLLALNRRLHKAYNRVREGDFSINGLMGFDLHGKTVGVVGTGKIGMAFVRIMQGFGCRLLATDVEQNPDAIALGVEYLPMEQVLAQSHILSLHCPLTPATHHLINDKALALMQPGVTLLNTSRGKLLDTKAVIAALKSGHIGLLGLDVYEEEESLFFEDLSDSIIHDDVFARLMTFPNVLITSHQAFFTKEAISAIAAITLDNVSSFERDGSLPNQVP